LRANLSGTFSIQRIDQWPAAFDPLVADQLLRRPAQISLMKERVQTSRKLLLRPVWEKGVDRLRIDQAMPINMLKDLSIVVGEKRISF
jgi:hypothetical protein